MLVRGDRLLMALSTLGLVRCYVSPRLGGAHAHVRAAHQRLYRRSRYTGDRSSNEVVGPKTSGAGAVEQDNHEDEWDTWEFGTWKVCVCYFTDVAPWEWLQWGGCLHKSTW